MTPSGEQFHLSAAGYTADVVQVGGGLRSLTYDGRHLVVPYDASQIMPNHRGAVLAPWPNRIADGRYEFEGAAHQVPINEVTRQNALHGLVSWLPWGPVERSESSLSLGVRLFAQPAYPFQLDLTVTYALDAQGLHWSLGALNSGEVAAPYGTSIHPYLLAGAGRVDEWTLDLPASAVLDVDPERLLPRSVVTVQDTVLDFRSPRQIGDTFIDHAFTSVASGADGLAQARVRAADGHGVSMSWDTGCPWVQVHTADQPVPEQSRLGLALEPMTCPPDAFNSGTDLVVLQPGASHQVSWHIAAF